MDNKIYFTALQKSLVSEAIFGALLLQMDQDDRMRLRAAVDTILSNLDTEILQQQLDVSDALAKSIRDQTRADFHRYMDGLENVPGHSN